MAITCLVAYICYLRKKVKEQRVALNRILGNSLPPGLNIRDVKAFTFKELSCATDDFSPSLELGHGGYGKVYKGILADGTAVAIKRAKRRSSQDDTQFFREIELLSRVHHRNLVGLVGFCTEREEQILVYEFMAGGTLRDHLIPTEMMDFGRRMHIALGTARGILYLHTEADPPIFHRDIKARNILLDNHYNAKVADFGLSILGSLAPIPDLSGSGPTVPDIETSSVMGTFGYVDPEYLTTQILTDKTDVYSFGVVLLELITGMTPICHGNSIVREVTRAMEDGEIISIADPRMGTYPSEKVLESLLELALACCQKESNARPCMLDIVRSLEDIWRIAQTMSSARKGDSKSQSVDKEQSLHDQSTGEHSSSDSVMDMSALLTGGDDQADELKRRTSAVYIDAR